MSFMLYTSSSKPFFAHSGQIPTALVTMGSDLSSLARLLGGLSRRLRDDGAGQVIVLESGDAPNLKAALKNIIRIAIADLEGNEGYQETLNDRAV
jgi:origin recognition complex subunit 3